jgi:hypothetical protein
MLIDQYVAIFEGSLGRCIRTLILSTRFTRINNSIAWIYRRQVWEMLSCGFRSGGMLVDQYVTGFESLSIYPVCLKIG